MCLTFGYRWIRIRWAPPIGRKLQEPSCPCHIVAVSDFFDLLDNNVDCTSNPCKCTCSTNCLSTEITSMDGCRMRICNTSQLLFIYIWIRVIWEYNMQHISHFCSYLSDCDRTWPDASSGRESWHRCTMGSVAEKDVAEAHKLHHHENSYGTHLHQTHLGRKTHYVNNARNTDQSENQQSNDTKPLRVWPPVHFQWGGGVVACHPHSCSLDSKQGLCGMD